MGCTAITAEGVLVVVQSLSHSPSLCDPIDCSMPSFPVLHHLLEFAQIHVHWVGDAICMQFLFSSVTQSYLTLWHPMDCGMPGLPVHPQIPEFTQTHVCWVGDAIQPSHPLSSPSPLAFNLSQDQGLFQWVSSSHQVSKVLEFQLQHQSFQWTLRTDLL